MSETVSESKVAREVARLTRARVAELTNLLNELDRKVEAGDDSYSALDNILSEAGHIVSEVNAAMNRIGEAQESGTLTD